MATTCKIEAQEVRVGQVWADNDPRNAGADRHVQVLAIEGSFAKCKNIKTGKITCIRITRFRPTNSGYRLVTAIYNHDTTAPAK